LHAEAVAAVRAAAWRDTAVRRRFAATVALLAALLTVLDPASTNGAGWTASAAFWLLTVALGLALAVVASRALARSSALATRPWLLLTLAGVAGLVLYAPVSLWLESALLPSALPEPDDDWLDAWERNGGWRALAAEAIQAGPAYFASWLLVNLPAWRNGATSAYPHGDAASSVAKREREPMPASAADAFLDRLPPAIGRELVAITADLHVVEAGAQG
jgi:hypothetical protein